MGVFDATMASISACFPSQMETAPVAGQMGISHYGDSEGEATRKFAVWFWKEVWLLSTPMGEGHKLLWREKPVLAQCNEPFAKWSVTCALAIGREV